MNILSLKRILVVGSAVFAARKLVAGFLSRQRQNRRQDQSSNHPKRTEIGKWESEGGNVPDVQTITPKSSSNY